jgi:hypothetical protein
LSLAQQLNAIFEGANAMATYVKEHYLTDPERKGREASEGQASQDGNEGK